MILEAIGRSRSGLSYSELTGLGIPGASIVRILRTLQRGGFVRQRPGSSRYHLGLRLHALGMAALARYEVVQLAVPMLPGLAAETGETAELIMLDDGELTWVATADAPEGMRLVGQAGTGLRTSRLHSVAPGKLFLALVTAAPRATAAITASTAGAGDPPASRCLLDWYAATRGLECYTPYTITDLDELRRAVTLIRAQGFAVDRQENRVGLWRCAAPVFDASGQVVASVGIAGSMARHIQARERTIVSACLAAAKTLSLALGGTDEQAPGHAGF